MLNADPVSTRKYFPICCRRCVEGNDACRPGSLGELASLLGQVEDLIVEDGEVERQTEAN